MSASTAGDGGLKSCLTSRSRVQTGDPRLRARNKVRFTKTITRKGSRCFNCLREDCGTGGIEEGLKRQL